MSLSGATGPAPTGIGAVSAAMSTARADHTRVDAHLEQHNAEPTSLGDEVAIQQAQKPIPIKPDCDRVPADLKALPQWVCWRYELKPGGKKPDKVPYQPNGYRASTTKPATWSKFEACCAAYSRGGFDGIGLVFDGAVGADGLCYCGVDFDGCIDPDNDKQPVQSLAVNRIKRLNTYTERSVSGTGFHCIARAEPLDRPVKFDGVEVYSKARYFTFTGKAYGLTGIKAAPIEIAALVREIRAKEIEAKQQPSDYPSAPNTLDFDVPEHFTKPAEAFASLNPHEDKLSDGIAETPWYETLAPQQKDEVVEHAVETIAKNTPLLELEANRGNNAQWYKLTTAVARSGAPNAENIFVKYASAAKDADPEDEIRRHFARCRASQLTARPTTVGTLLQMAQQCGADFDRWKGQAPPGPETARSASWDPAELKISFANIPHRKWLYGTDLIRGEVTVEAAPGGAGKTAHATAMATAIATGIELLGERIYKAHDDLKALYINGEDSKIELIRRVLAGCMAHADKIPVRPPNRLYVAGADDARVQQIAFLRMKDAAWELNRIGFEPLEAAISAVHPDLVVLDPLVVFCAGGNTNDNALMAQIIRELKRLAMQYDCAVLVLHHTRKGGVGNGGNAEDISGASAIVNLARKAIMPVTMTEAEAANLRVPPSERLQYFKLVDAKSNLAPRTDSSPWYHLHNVSIPNPEPPVYPHGDGVQAVVRVNLPAAPTASENEENQKMRKAILDLVSRGKMIDGQTCPYSPNLAGAKNERALLDDAIAAVQVATAPKQWPPKDLGAATKDAISAMMAERVLLNDEIKKGRFRGGRGLSVNPARVSSAADETPTAAEGEVLLQMTGQLGNSRSID